MNILITNDDGINSSKIKLLAKNLTKYGTVYVVAPAFEQSAVSNALTVRGLMEVNKIDDFESDIQAWSLTGTPADCIKFAIIELGIKPDIIFSGINDGANLGTDILYSGTIGGATEGNIMGIPAVAISGPRGNEIDFDIYLKSIIPNVFDNHLYDKNIVMNINIPDCEIEDCKGYKITHQGSKPHATKFIKVDEKYKSGGEELFIDNNKESDVYCYTNKYISITPIKMDRTDYIYIKKIENIFLK